MITGKQFLSAVELGEHPAPLPEQVAGHVQLVADITGCHVSRCPRRGQGSRVTGAVITRLSSRGMTQQQLYVLLHLVYVVSKPEGGPSPDAGPVSLTLKGI